MSSETRLKSILSNFFPRKTGNENKTSSSTNILRDRITHDVLNCFPSKCAVSLSYVGSCNFWRKLKDGEMFIPNSSWKINKALVWFSTVTFKRLVLFVTSLSRRVYFQLFWMRNISGINFSSRRHVDRRHACVSRSLLKYPMEFLRYCSISKRETSKSLEMGLCIFTRTSFTI